MATSRNWPQRWGCVRGVVQSPIPILVALPLHRNAGGIADLDPHRARPGSISAVHPLRNDALGAKPASVLEHGRAILGDVFVEQDARLRIAQQSRQRGLAVEKRAIAQILAVVLDQVERVEDRCTCGSPAAQRIELGQTVRSYHNRLPVDREALGLDPLRSTGDRREPGGQVNPVAAVQSRNGTVAADDQSVSVMLDFMDPIGTGRRS